jgi:ABC-2 type transport system permease protein
MSLEAYLQYWRINLLTMLEYRANFIMWSGFTFFYHATALAALWVTLTTFPSMNGWSMHDMAFLYALRMLCSSFSNTFFFSVGEVPAMIREGRFDRFLVRPLDELFQALTVPQSIYPDELIMALLFLPLATWFAHVRVDAFYFAFVLLVMLGGALIDFGIQLVVATIAFWTIRTDTLRWVVMSLEQEFTRYPVSIYTRIVRIVLTFVLPFAFMNYFPASYLLRKHEGTLSLAPEAGLLTPLVGVVWISLAYAFWRAGLNRYQGTGS